MQSSTNKNKNKNKMMSFNTRLAMTFFFWVEIRAFVVVVLKNLAFSTLKSFYHLIYNRANVKCSIFFNTLFKIINEESEFEFFNLRKRYNFIKILY